MGGLNRGKAGGCSVHTQMKTDMVESEEEVHCRGIYEDSLGLDSPPGCESCSQSSSHHRTCVKTIHANAASG